MKPPFEAIHRDEDKYIRLEASPVPDSTLLCVDARDRKQLSKRRFEDRVTRIYLTREAQERLYAMLGKTLGKHAAPLTDLEVDLLRLTTEGMLATVADGKRRALKVRFGPKTVNIDPAVVVKMPDRLSVRIRVPKRAKAK